MSYSPKIFFWLWLFWSSFFHTSYAAQNIKKADPTPPILNRVWVQGEVYAADTVPGKLNEIPLPYGKNFFTIEFISINYNQNEKLSYSYMLEGIDSTWVFSGDQRRVSYANLGPGTYPFRVKVSNDGINWVYNHQKINVVVTPPFWAKWWFSISVIFFVFTLLWAIYQLRVNAAIKRALEIANIRRKESESLRLMMAQDFHDEMGNKLASIIVLVSTLQMLIKDKNNEIQKALTRIETASKQLFDGTKSFIWSINPKSDKLSEIINYICNFGTELFDNTSIEFEVKKGIPANLIKTKLPVGYSRQLFFIFKEAMTNSLMHSKCTQAQLIFSVDIKTNKLKIDFEDNGKGLSQDQLMSSRGITNMKTRARRINYDLTFFHNLNGGLGVHIEGEFPKT